jgi:hypothetical protein
MPDDDAGTVCHCQPPSAARQHMDALAPLQGRNTPLQGRNSHMMHFISQRLVLDHLVRLPQHAASAHCQYAPRYGYAKPTWNSTETQMPIQQCTSRPCAQPPHTVTTTVRAMVTPEAHAGPPKC